MIENGSRLTLPRQFLRNCRQAGRRSKVADSTGVDLSGADLLLRTLVVRRLLARHVLAPDERFVGLLLPPSAGAVLVNAALPLLNRIPVNLNYTTSSALMNQCIAQCGIRHVLTSRRVLERFPVTLDAELVCLEDLRDALTVADKAIAWAESQLPMARLERRLGIADVAGDDLMAVLFTSGSTGEPKGVMLTHDNVASQVDALRQVIDMRATDVALGVMPFFHAYGYTATLWTVLALPPKGVYHMDPREGQRIGVLCRAHGVTVLMGTPTFLRMYLRRVPPEDFRSLDVVFASSEPLSAALSDAFEARFGVRPFDAYGCTELSPVVSLNVPPSRQVAGGPQARDGTVGRALPGVEAAVVEAGTGTARPAGEAGQLLVRGPNVMAGYLNRPDLSSEVIRDGWYVTGDVASIDADGFIRLLGRERRFSKIGGEMVPHVMVETLLQQILGGDEEHLKAAVTGVPDPVAGERVVVLHLATDQTPDHMCRALGGAGLPPLWTPSLRDFYEVDELPILGTGKLDLVRLDALARARTGGSE